MPGEEERGAFFDEPKPVLDTMEKGPKEEAGSKVEEYEKASQRLQIVKANETSIFLKKDPSLPFFYPDLPALLSK